MDPRGIIVCIAVFVVGCITVWLLECLKNNDSSENSKINFPKDRHIVNEREAILKIIAAVAETAVGWYCFGKNISNVTGMGNILSLVIIGLVSAFLTSAWCNMLPRKLALKSKNHSDKVYKAGIFVYHVIAPLWFIQYAIGYVTSLVFGVKNKNDDDTVTEEKILKMVDEGSETGTIEESQMEMINNIFDFDDTLVSDVMTHRKDMVAIPDTLTLEEAVKVTVKEGYSRIPVYSGNIDKITGMIYAKDLLAIVSNRNDMSVSVKNYMRKAKFVPEMAKCSDVLKFMLKNKTQIAIVSDEYGGTFGIVCMEDLIEEIVGNIQDEYDNEEAEIKKLDDGSFIVDGDTRPEDVVEETGIKLPDDNKYDTIGGFVVDLIGHIPEEDESVEVDYENATFKVMEVKDNWITKIKIIPKIKTENKNEQN